jgi:hypothetical protein
VLLIFLSSDLMLRSDLKFLEKGLQVDIHFLSLLSGRLDQKVQVCILARHVGIDFFLCYVLFE